MKRSLRSGASAKREAVRRPSKMMRIKDTPP
jgi:hypothetical protein